MDVLTIRTRWLGLLLGLALLQGMVAGAVWSQTTIERSRDIPVDTDTNLPDFEGNPVSQDELGDASSSDSETAESTEVAESPATAEDGSGSNTIEFVPSEPDSSSSAPSYTAIVRYNIRKNVCTGHWSMAELKALFPGVDAEMVRDVCG